mmetsp:Transcript_2445/g.3655  ORF Transcript_2445/g.3655 Transcript_2445/m.3655 type:complete len:288 (+) Transcript_2445:62-925(+)
MEKRWTKKTIFSIIACCYLPNFGFAFTSNAATQNHCCNFARNHHHPQRGNSVSPSSLHSRSRSSDETHPEDGATATELKTELLSIGAAYDRGFGATPSVRTKASSLIRQLSTLNPTPDAAESIDTDGPLRGTWQMVWTTALDVLSLAASPISTVSAIYQDIDPPIATNIIDLIPRAQAALPPGWAPSLTRASVITRTNRRKSALNRVGLVFESVEVRQVEVLGVKVPEGLPLKLKFDLPRIAGASFAGEDGPGYFDVVYLDDDMLIINQNEPGGTFVSVRVPSADLD